MRRTLALALLLVGCGPVMTVMEPDSGPAVMEDGGVVKLLELGTGTQVFMPLTDGQGVTVIAGPQGGYHIWAAARVQSPMQPMQITFRVKVKLAGTELTSTDYRVNAVKNGRYFEWYAMTALVPDPADVRGKPTVVELIATDSAGRTASDVRTVVPSGP